MIEEFDLIFYEDSRGFSDVENYLDELLEKAKTSKEHRLNYEKIMAYLQVLSVKGTKAGKPYVKRIDEEIWELRPLKNRIFFFYKKENSYVLLHHFIKKTQKTPNKEIEKARNEMLDYLARHKNEKG